MSKIIELYQFKSAVVDCIDLGQFQSIFDNWHQTYFKGVSGGLDEKKMIGASILKRVYRYNDRQLSEALSTSYELRNLLGLGNYFSKDVFLNAYTNFRRVIYRDYYSNNRNLFVDCLLRVTSNGKFTIKFNQNSSLLIDLNEVLCDIIYQQIYVLVFKSMLELYHNNISYIETNIRSKIEDLSSRSQDVIYSLNHTQLTYRLDTLGETSHMLLGRLGIGMGSNNKLRTYFDKYYELKNGKVYLREIKISSNSTYSTANSVKNKTASELFSQRKISTTFHSSASSNYTPDNVVPKQSQPQATPKPVCSEINIEGYAQLLKELSNINNRIHLLEKKIDTISGTIERQFNSLTPFEKQLSRLETLYSSIQGLDKRILLQEESLRSMVEKHMQIAMYSQELSQTSKDVYELMKLFLLESIMTKTK